MNASKQIFSASQRSLVNAVLNRLVPPEGKLPGAGDLGVGQFLEGVAAGSPALTRLFLAGLAEIDIAASRANDIEFTALTAEAQDAVLLSVEASNPTFFEQLVRQTYNGYYTNTEVFEDIGYNTPIPPVPGAQPDLLDVSLLDQQRQRAPFWTKV